MRPESIPCAQYSIASILKAAGSAGFVITVILQSGTTTGRNVSAPARYLALLFSRTALWWGNNGSAHRPFVAVDVGSRSSRDARRRPANAQEQCDHKG